MLLMHNGCGRLGNNMFQYAFLRTYAKNNNINYVFGTRKFNETLNKIFNLQNNEVINNKFIKTSGMKKLNECVKLNYDNIEIKGLLQNFWSINYFHNNYYDVKKWFTPKQEFIDEALEFWSNKPQTCACHIRGTDFKKIRSRGKLRIPYKEWYPAVCKYLINKGYEPLIITDDIEYCKQLGLNNIYSTSMCSDFAKLLHAPNLACANSTFSWWAAYLNQDRYILNPIYCGGHIDIPFKWDKLKWDKPDLLGVK